ncbi:MAG: acyl carrier protein [Clostridia bacterium]|nr:acyl carrier protein [Clostridia bacterium]
MVYEKVVSILCEQLMLEADQIAMDTAITDDLGADSLDLVEVLMSCEDEFDIEIPDDEAEKFKCVGDLVRFIENNQ